MPKKPYEPYTPTKEEVRMIIQESKKYHPVTNLVIRILAQTGKRLGEVLSLRAKDVYPDKNALWLPIFKLKKLEYDWNFIGDKTMKDLVSYMKEKGIEGEDKVFSGRSKRSVQRDFKKIIRSLGIRVPHGKTLSLHSFRHFVVTFNRQEKDMPYDNIAERFTKHRSLETMKRTYSHVDLMKKKDSILKDIRDMVEEF